MFLTGLNRDLRCGQVAMFFSIGGRFDEGDV